MFFVMILLNWLIDTSVKERGINMERDSRKLSILLKKIRINNGEMLMDMANKLKISSTFLSAIENGKKKVPDDFKDKLCANYTLSEDEIKDLNEGIVINNDKVDLTLSELSGSRRELAISLGRSFDTLSDEAVDELLNIIGKE